LTVLVPDNVSAPGRILPSNVDEDIFFTDSVDKETGLTKLLQLEMKAADSTLLMAETSYSEPEVKDLPDPLSWVHFTPATNVARNSAVACLERMETNEGSVKMLLSRASGYPSIIAISSARLTRFVKGVVTHLDQEQASRIIKAVKLIAVGVFDERSMMIWSKSASS
jgi:hypothetical protein